MFTWYLYDPDTNDGGNHEIHVIDCPGASDPLDFKLIGLFDNAQDAIKAVKEQTGKTNFVSCKCLRVTTGS